jgi:hypothetical protein
MSNQLDALLDAERAREIAKNDEAMRAEDERMRLVQPAVLGPRMLVPAIAFVAAAALSACAASPDDESRADVHCTIEQLVPIVVGDQVLMIPGKCIAWGIGPGREQQQKFEQAHGRSL